MEKSCVIQFNPEGIDVTFAGDWQRSDLDRVQVALFKELPKHINERRKNLRKEKEDE